LDPFPALRKKIPFQQLNFFHAINPSIDGGLKLCFFDEGGVFDSIHPLLLMKTIEKVIFLHGKI